jgi:hypothetical protein
MYKIEANYQKHFKYLAMNGIQQLECSVYHYSVHPTWPSVECGWLSVITQTSLRYSSDPKLVVLSWFEPRDPVIGIWYIVCHWSPVV